ncbi:hypothetical protein D3C81_2036120 [compost metagenome]
MVIEVVTHLVVGNVFRFFGEPMQHLHAVTASAGCDHVENFTGAAMAADFQTWQVAHLADQRARIGLVHTKLANPLAAAVVEVALVVVITTVADHRAYAGQLIAQVPAERLACLQLV